MQYTVYTRTGKTFSVDSDLTDAEAQEVLATKAPASDDFAGSLAGKAKLSPKMRAWLHVKAQWLLNPRERAESTRAFPGILAMLTKAREAGKKFPKIKLHVAPGADYAASPSRNVVIYLGRNGKANVTDGGGYGRGTWFGAIQPDGSFREGTDAARVLPILSELDADPLRVAAQHGVATGECCFCARELTTKESRSVGYGPVCAARHGLEWGKIDPELDREGKGVFNV